MITIYWSTDDGHDYFQTMEEVEADFKIRQAWDHKTTWEEWLRLFGKIECTQKEYDQFLYAEKAWQITKKVLLLRMVKTSL